MSVLNEMVAAADAYTESYPLGHLTPAPSRHVTVVACMDARLDLFRMLGLDIGDSHILRNAGGTVTDDTLRSLAISQRKLGTRSTMLVHHTGCGMAMIDDEDFLDELESESGVRPTWKPGGFAKPEDDVRASLERIRACPWLVSTEARGFVFDVATGHLIEVAD
jgi:carbonic anhydrase